MCSKRDLIIHLFFLHNRYSVFQSEARIFLGFSQIKPQNMLEIYLSKNIQKRNLHDLTNVWGQGVGRGYQNEKILKFVPFRLLKLLT